MQQLWANKYRPATFDECVGTIGERRHLLNEMQHLLLHSRGAGTGKTTLAYVLANELNYPIHVFNASSKKTRGIAFVEQELIPLTRSGNYKQIILLDEADQLTPEAQSALKGVIENSQGYFILTCNDISKVSPWIKSRCRMFTVDPINEEDMMSRLIHICGLEGSRILETQLRIICRSHKGDLRNAINALQAFHSMDDKTGHQFVLGMTTDTFDAKRFLSLCFEHKDLTHAYNVFKEEECRKGVRRVFDTVLGNTDGLYTATEILQVVDAAITAERDILNGVEEDIIKVNFIRMLIA